MKNLVLTNKDTVKTISWMLIAAVMITLCGYFETGLLSASIRAAIWASLIKTPIYYLHERGAAMLFGRLGSEPEPQVTCSRCLEAV